MADRYWVGGAGTWDASSTTNWSATSGGANGASAPSAADNVFFDSGSGTPGSITLLGNVSGISCLDLTVSVSGWTFTSSGSFAGFKCYGNFSLATGTFWTTPTNTSISFLATSTGKTVTTNGCNISCLVLFNSSTGGWTLGSSLTVARTLSITAGTFDTSASNYSVTCLTLNISGSTSRTIYFRGSTITITGSGTNAFNAATTTSLSFSAAASSIVCTGVGNSYVTFTCASLTFGSVSFPNTSAGSSVTITGAFPSFGTLSITPPTATYVKPVYINCTGNVTVTGQFIITTGTTAPASRVWISGSQANSYTKSGSIILSGTSTLYPDIDFSNISFFGVGSPITGTRFSDRGNTAGITYPAAKTVYYVQAAGGNYTDNAWSTSSGGAVVNTNFPLSQDTVYIDNNSLSAGNTLTFNGLNVGLANVIMSNRTAVMNLAFSDTSYSSNSLTLTPNASSPHAITYSAYASGSLKLMPAPSTSVYVKTDSTQQLPVNLYIDATDPTGSFTGSTVGDFSCYAIYLIAGSFNVANYNVTSTTFNSLTDTAQRSINFGSTANQILTLTGTQAVNFATSSSNLTVNFGTSKILCTYSGGSTAYFTGGNKTFYSVVFYGPAPGGSSQVWFSDGNTFFNISNSGVVSMNLDAVVPTVIQNSFDIRGVSGSLSSITGLITKSGGVVSVDYLSIYGSSASGASWYAGSHSTNSGSNTGWIFASPPSGNMMAFIRRR